jgi:hypothetical protein
MSVDYEKSLGNRTFQSIEVRGELTWDKRNYANSYSLSQLFENAVTLDTDQTITGKVVFSKGFETRELTSYPWIDNVNLMEILEDSVNPDSPNKLVHQISQ